MINLSLKFEKNCIHLLVLFLGTNFGSNLISISFPYTQTVLIVVALMKREMFGPRSDA